MEILSIRNFYGTYMLTLDIGGRGAFKTVGVMGKSVDDLIVDLNGQYFFAELAFTSTIQAQWRAMLEDAMANA